MFLNARMERILSQKHPWTLWAIGISLGWFSILFFGVFSAQAAVYTVNTTEDATDGVCDDIYLADVSDCTLREAIEAANGNTGVDRIRFLIDEIFADDGSGQWEISIESALPIVTDTVSISAAEVWDVDDDRPGIHLVGSSDDGLTFDLGSAGSFLQGLEFSGFARGILIMDDDVTIGTDCDIAFDAQERNVIYDSSVFDVYIEEAGGVVVRGNYLGVRADGVTAESVSGSEAVKIFGAQADHNTIGYVEGTSNVCPLDLQRNIIGGRGTLPGIRIESGAGNIEDGDATLAPDDVRVSGNHIGIGADGASNIAGTDVGVDLRRGATSNVIGDDGDGVDDDLEGNLIANWGSNGVVVFRTGFNRIAGNTIVDNGLHGILVRGTQNTVKRNIVGENAANGIRVGAACNGCLIYGNFVGTDPDGAQLGNGEAGIYVHPGLSGVRVGGAEAGQGNTVAFNDEGGIVIDGLFCFGSACTADREPTTDFLVEGNRVTNNETFGIQILGTDVSSSGTPGTGTVRGNTLENNNGVGLALEAASPIVQDNEIASNTSYGIRILSGYSDPAYVPPAQDEVGSYNPPVPAISSPSLSGNTVSNHQTGGIFVLNALPDGSASLFANNMLSSNGAFEVRRDAFFSIRLSSPGDADLTNDPFTIGLRPSGDLVCTQVCDTSSSAFDTTDEETIWGPEGIVAGDPRTWFQVTDFSVDETGTEDTYGPYRVLVTGNVVAEFYQPIETAENGDSSTTAPVVVHYPHSGTNNNFPSAAPSSSSADAFAENDMETLTPGVPANEEHHSHEARASNLGLSSDLSEAIGGGGGIALLESFAYFAQPFSFVKTNDRDTVYMVDIDQTRRPFLNDRIFFTWQDDFRFVRVISEMEMNSIPLGSPMLPRPGTVLVKQAYDTRVYAVELNMILRWIPLESQVRELYGENWSAQVMDLDPILFSKYTIARDPLDFHEYPNGTLLHNGTRRCQVYFGWCNEITTNGFAANRLSERFVRAVPSDALERLPRHRPIERMEDAFLTERLAFL